MSSMRACILPGNGQPYKGSFTASKPRTSHQVCNALRLIEVSSDTSYNKSAMMDSISYRLRDRGAYAVTHLVLDLAHNDILEKELSKVVHDLSRVVQSYKNLRKLSISAPYAALDGTHVQSLIDLECPYNELDLAVWAFHTPLPRMWKGRKLKSLEISVCDGVAFHNSINHMLCGLKQGQEGNLRHLSVVNETPHHITISNNLLPKVDTSNIVNIDIASPIWWFADKPMRL